jgi:hypothetical protein
MIEEHRLDKERRIEKLKGHLDELEKNAERAGEVTEGALKRVQKERSLPEVLHNPEDLEEGEHYPGLG